MMRLLPKVVVCSSKLSLTRHHKSNDLIVIRLRDKALPDFFATTQNQYPIANLKNVVEIMRNENHSYAALFEFLDYLHDFPLLGHTQSRRRFIHDQHARFPMDGTSNGNRLTLPP
jgi:hypothetical protein